MLPTRRTYAWLAVAAMAFAVYVSLIPFRLRMLPFGDALAGFATVITTPVAGRLSRTNFLANLLLFLPVGFGLAGARLADRTRHAAAVAAAAGISLMLSVAVSLLAEFLQMFAPGRVPALSDVQAQAVGCVAGFAGWLAFGQPLTGWLRAAQTRNGSDRLAKAVAAYAVAWTLVNLAPFDITLDLGELAQRFRSGMIALMPFAGVARPPSRVLWDALITTVSAMPLGALGLVGRGREAPGRRTAPAALAIGAGLVLAVEGAQIFITSHAADAADVMFGWLGVVLGLIVARRLIPEALAGGQVGRDFGRRWGVGLLTAWCVVLFIYHWMPYDFSIDAATIRGKVGAISLAPFAGYASGSDLNALNDLLVKAGLSVPLGAIAAFVVRRDGRATFGGAIGIAAATLVFGIVEAGQLFLPSRSPDPTDVLVGVVGTAAGLRFGRWLRSDL